MSSPAPSPSASEPSPQVDAYIEHLIHSYANLVLRLSYARLGSTYAAQDICQQVFLKLVELSHLGLANFASPEHEKAWIIRATINACTNEQASAWNSKVVPLDADAPNSTVFEPATPPDDDPLALFEAAVAHANVRAALAELSPAQRQAVYLRYYEGYAVQDIAQLTGETPNTVSQHLSRARTKLRGILEGGLA